MRMEEAVEIVQRGIASGPEDSSFSRWRPRVEDITSSAARRTASAGF